MTLDAADYCREIETYLCRKNDGHLIRVVGPSFELVSGWAASGVPLKVAFRGIDRYVERYYRKGSRRRPVRIDFCEADVLDVFDEWRRAVGLPASGDGREEGAEPAASTAAKRRTESLPAHLDRVLTRLTNARATGALGSDADPLIDRLSADLDTVRASAGGLRGAARQELMARLTTADAELIATARAGLSGPERIELDAQADDELRRFRPSLSADAYARAHEAALARLVRERFNLPTLVFD